MYISYLLQTILQGSLETAFFIFCCLQQHNPPLFRDWDMNWAGLNQLSSSYFLDNFVYSWVQASESARMASKPFQIWKYLTYRDMLKQSGMMSLLGGICLALARAHGRPRQPSAPLALEFWQEREWLIINYDHKLSKVRTFPNVLSWLKKVKCWATLQKK